MFKASLVCISSSRTARAILLKACLKQKNRNKQKKREREKIDTEKEAGEKKEKRDKRKFQTQRELLDKQVSVAWHEKKQWRWWGHWQ